MILYNLLVAFGKITHSNPDDEKELMKRIKARDPKALKQLYNIYGTLLYGLVIPIVKKREEAEDVLQEAFITIWEKANTFDEDRGNVYSWIVTLTRNKAIDRIRSKGYKSQQKASVSTSEPDFTLEGDRYDPLETTIHSDRAELVKMALDQIPEKQREVIKIAYYQGMTQSEIADHLNLPLGTVKTRTRQGLIKLKDILEAYISRNE